MAETLGAVAVVGLAGRFPGAPGIAAFWRNLCAGVDSIRRFSPVELAAAGVPAALADDPDYVGAEGVIEGVEDFDADFFGITRREAEVTDPQQRLALECAWEALEDAGHAPGGGRRRVGVWAGASPGTYARYHLAAAPELVEAVGPMLISVHNRTDHLAPWISYKLDLRGPSVTVQTACSTSLVAVHLACQSLLAYQCDLALAGGVSLRLSHRRGHLHRAGGVMAADGRCRPFDAAAAGIVGGNGAGMVALRRLDEALAAGDTVRAVILGSAVNNDGALKAGYTAPSVDGQAEVIAEALAVAGVEPDTVSFVEAHGTGTPLGDPIEVAALTQAFGAGTGRRGFCALGAVKSNIGHLDAAAGVAGLIKTVLALEHGELPPTLHFSAANPRIDFASSPFYPLAVRTPWPRGATPRRAGVSAFGFGGTNAHAVLEEAPSAAAPGRSRPWQLLTLSARTPSALAAASGALARRLAADPGVDLADAAYTLAVGRRAFDHRRIVVCRDRGDAASALDPPDPRRLFDSTRPPRPRPVVFLFPGQGAQHAGMTAGLYAAEPVFRRWVDRGCELLAAPLESDLRRLLYPAADERAAAAALLAETRYAQPALFVVEHALAQLWKEWGIEPAALLGHSLGELVAACVAGVFGFADALSLVAARGALMQRTPPGAMLAVARPAEELAEWLDDGGELALAAVNGPAACVLSGPEETVERLQRRLAADAVACRRLATAHAFHSAAMDGVAEPFRQVLETVTAQPPEVPMLSNVTGTWAEPDEVAAPGYWLRQLRRTVRFSDALTELFCDPERVLLEVGPGRTLSNLARLHPARAPGQPTLASLGATRRQSDEQALLLTALGRLWLAGAAPDWDAFWRGERRRRVPLPTYPFERRRLWVDPPPAGARPEPAAAGWLYAPAWTQAPLPVAAGDRPAAGRWLLFLDRCGVGERLGEQLAAAGAVVATAAAGERFARLGDRAFTLAPADAAGYEELLAALAADGGAPDRIVHLWTVTADRGAIDDRRAGRLLELGITSLILLARALGRRPAGAEVEIAAVSSALHDVLGDGSSVPEKATLLGPCRVIPQELPGVACRHLDLAAGAGDDPAAAAGRLLDELLAGGDELSVALRGARRWVERHRPTELPAPAATPRRLRRRGVYLITGGLGGLGLEFAAELARLVAARLVLTGRSPFPAPEERDAWLRDHGGDDPVSRAILRLRELEAAGAEVLVARADVADRVAMARVVAAAGERFGAIHGVIHAAGVPGPGIIDRKTAATVAEVLAPKVAGTRVLAELLGEGGLGGLDFVLLCSSRSALLGGRGQADYAGANAFLDAFAAQRGDRGEPVVSVAWCGWREVGMRARMLARRRDGTAAATGTAGGRRPAATVSPAAAGAGEPTGHPLLERLLAADGRREVYATRFSPDRHWLLNDHRVLGRPVIPGVGYFEMARAALARHADGGTVELSDVFFVAPLSVADGTEREVRLVLERAGDGWTFRVLGAEPGGGWREFATGRGAIGPPAAPPRHDLERLVAGLGVEEVIEHDLRRSDDELGPRWQTLERVYRGRAELVALYELPHELAGDLDALVIHPGMLDRATGGGGDYLVGELGASYLPLSHRRVRIYGRFPRRIATHVRFREELGQGETLTFDVTVMDRDGVELVAIEGFTHKRFGAGLFGAGRAAAAAASGVERRDDGARRGAAAGAASAAAATPDGLGAGISTRRGLAILRRVLDAAGPARVVVSPQPLAAMQAAARRRPGDEPAGGEPAPAPTVHPRPEVATLYAEPAGEAETAIAAAWQKVLGVERIGRDDDFFALGGDSVLAIQVIVGLRRQGLELTPQRLFDHPTVAELAAALAADEPAAAAAGAGAAEVPLTAQQMDELASPACLQPAGRVLLLEARQELAPAALAAALAALAARHPALRLRLAGAGSGRGPGAALRPAATPPPPLTVADLPALPPAAAGAARRRLAGGLAAGLDPAGGPVCAAVLVRQPGEPDRVLLAIDRRIADPASWPVLVDDLATAYRRLAAGAEPELPAPSCDPAAWAAAVTGEAMVRRCREELATWCTALQRARRPAELAGAAAAGGAAAAELGAEATRALLERVGAAYGTRTVEVLFAAAGRALGRLFGDGPVRIDVEIDGRVAAPPAVDPSRLVGFATATVPAVCEADAGTAPGAALTAAKERLRGLPQGGLGFAVLRRLGGEECAARLDALPAALLLLRWLGPPPAAADGAPWRPLEWLEGPAAAAAGGARFVLDARVSGGRLCLACAAADPGDRPLAGRLAAATASALAELIDHCAAPGAGAFTPSDFPLAGLGGDDLERLMSRIAAEPEGEPG